MDQQPAATPEIISYSVQPNGDANFLIFIPSEFLAKEHVLDLNVMTAACLEAAKSQDPSINFDPERPHTIGWAVGMDNLVPRPTGPVDLNDNVTTNWCGIDYRSNLEPDTHFLRGECKGDLNGLLELKGVTVGIERVVTHL